MEVSEVSALRIERLQPRDIQDALVVALRDHMLRGDLKAGDRLPPERELAAMLNVSRGALRESLKSLRAIGLITVLPGRGTILAQNPHHALASIAHSSWLLNESGMRDLVEVRMIVEQNTARLAAERATAEGVERLYSALDDLEAVGDDSEAYITRDIEFHITLAESTGNLSLAGLLAPLADLLIELSRFVVILPNRISQANQEHREIVKAIAERKAVHAQRLAKEHLRVYLASAHLTDPPADDVR